MPTPHPDDRLIAQQAARWLDVLKGANARERRAFAAWLLESRRHVRNFLLMTAFERELKKIDPQRRHDVEALLREAAPEVVALPGLSGGVVQPRARPARWRWAVGIAATIVIAVSAARLATHSGLIPRAYTTAIGEQRSIKLPDGSVVQLNTNSRVELHFSKEARDVRLLAGEALFVVAHDRARPFRVDTGTAIVQAVGTQFNLYRHQDRTTVSVIEGRVQITTAAAPPKMSALAQRSAPPMPIPLAVGEEATVGGDGHIIKRATPDVTRAIAWRERRLVFRDDPLTDVIVEFNRYNSLQLRVEGEDVGRRRFTGVLDADNPEALLKILATEPDLGFDRSGSAVVIRGR